GCGGRGGADEPGREGTGAGLILPFRARRRTSPEGDLGARPPIPGHATWELSPVPGAPASASIRDALLEEFANTIRCADARSPVIGCDDGLDLVRGQTQLEKYLDRRVSASAPPASCAHEHDVPQVVTLDPAISRFGLPAATDRRHHIDKPLHISTTAAVRGRLASLPIPQFSKNEKGGIFITEEAYEGSGSTSSLA